MGSRQVMLYAALIALALAVFGKFGALFSMIPNPVAGGILMIEFGILVLCIPTILMLMLHCYVHLYSAVIMSVGFNLLQYVDLRSHRNVFVMAAALFFGVALPQWIGQKQNQKYLATGTAFFIISIHVAITEYGIFLNLLIGIDWIDQIVGTFCTNQIAVGGFIATFLDLTLPGKRCALL